MNTHRIHRRLVSCLLVLTFFLIANKAKAETTRIDSIKTKTVSAPKDTSINIYSAYLYGHRKKPDSNNVRLGDIIVVRLRNLSALIRKANPPQGTKQDIRLFLGGQQIDDMVPLAIDPTKSGDSIEFKLIRTSLNSGTWTNLLGAPGYGDFYRRCTDVSVGIDKSYAESSSGHVNIVRIRKGWFIVCLIVFVAYLIILTYSAQKTKILRDNSVNLSALGISANNNVLPPYSLAKVQMAFWFSVVVISFMFIWLITGNYDLITSGILGLIGISGTTALSAVVIDNGKSQSSITQILTLQQQESTIIDKIKQLQAQNPPAPTTAGDTAFAITQQKQVRDNINQLLNGLQLKTANFLNDILTDVNGYSFHRLQMFIWTIVLGVVFIYSVWASLSMPDFSSTQLALLGITAGTYLGFKFPEQQS